MHIDIDDVDGLENLLEEIKGNQRILAKALFKGTEGYAEILQEELQALLRGRRHLALLPPGVGYTLGLIVTVQRKEESVWSARVSPLNADLFLRYPEHRKKYEEAIDEAVKFLRAEVADRCGILLQNTSKSDVDVIVEAVYG